MNWLPVRFYKTGAPTAPSAKFIVMFARIANLWAALKFALGNGRPEELELDAEGQQRLERLLSVLSEQGKKIDESQIEMAREVVTRSKRFEKLLADPNVETTEFVRQIDECDWKTKICENRKSIRLDCWLIILLATSTIGLHLFGLESWSAAVNGFLTAWIFGLLFKLDLTWKDRELKRVNLEYMTAVKEGDNQKAMAIHESYVAKMEARTEKFLGEKI